MGTTYNFDINIDASGRFTCEYTGCNRNYSTVGNLRTHMKTHKGNKCEILSIYISVSLKFFYFFANRIISYRKVSETNNSIWIVFSIVICNIFLI